MTTQPRTSAKAHAIVPPADSLRPAMTLSIVLLLVLVLFDLLIIGGSGAP